MCNTVISPTPTHFWLMCYMGTPLCLQASRAKGAGGCVSARCRCAVCLQVCHRPATCACSRCPRTGQVLIRSSWVWILVIAYPPPIENIQSALQWVTSPLGVGGGHCPGKATGTSHSPPPFKSPCLFKDGPAKDLKALCGLDSPPSCLVYIWAGTPSKAQLLCFSFVLPQSKFTQCTFDSPMTDLLISPPLSGAIRHSYVNSCWPDLAGGV